MKKLLVVILIASVSLVANASDPKSELKIKQRRAAFTIMSAYVSRLVNMADGEVTYDKRAAVENAKLIEILSKLPWEFFVPGTEFGDTRAKPEIWFEEDKFKELAQDTQNKVKLLRLAAETGNPEKLKNALVVARKSCSTCHDQFRKKID